MNIILCGVVVFVLFISNKAFSELLNDKKRENEKNYSLSVLLPSGYDRENKRYSVAYLINLNVDFLQLEREINKDKWYLNTKSKEYVSNVIYVNVQYNFSRDISRDNSYLEFYDNLYHNIIPAIERTYSVNSDRLMIANNEFAGFSLQMLLSKNSLFNRYIILDAHFMKIKKFLYEQEVKYAKAYSYLNARVFIGISKHSELKGELTMFIKTIKERMYQGFSSKTLIYNEPSAISHIMHGLCFIYA